ncbi:MAG: trypsin-like serine protease [Actinomycetota bacterium]|nr:trypsin-like serine protease [Actinomycetota bacterium]
MSTGASQQPATESAHTESFGFVKKRFPMIGRIWVLTDGKWQAMCSGTVVSRELVLTAGHCVTDAHNNHAYRERIAFVPGQTWNDPNSRDPRDIRAPYGVWEARNWWTPDSYRKADGPDWGLIQIQPHGATYIGDVVHTWRIATGLSLYPNERLWLAGYPAEGFWNTAPGHEGRGLYSCASAWDGGNWVKGSAPNDIVYVANCTMNGGASGGPWFARLPNGPWVIIGVNNWCYDDNKKDDAPGTYCTPRSSQLQTLEFDARFLSFWASVNTQLRR